MSGEEDISLQQLEYYTPEMYYTTLTDQSTSFWDWKRNRDILDSFTVNLWVARETAEDSIAEISNSSFVLLALAESCSKETQLHIYIYRKLIRARNVYEPFQPRVDSLNFALNLYFACYWAPPNYWIPNSVIRPPLGHFQWNQILRVSFSVNCMVVFRIIQRARVPYSFSDHSLTEPPEFHICSAGLSEPREDLFRGSAN